MSDRSVTDATAAADDNEAPRARAFWSGTISFGLVSIPVDLYPANRPQRVSLRMLDVDGTPLQRQYYDPETGEPVAADRLVRGYEIAADEFVVVTDEELEALAPRKTRDIDLRLFVPIDQLEPLYFERAYFLTPAGNSNKAYRLLAQTMERTQKAGIATFVMRTKEYLIAILAENGMLRAETLRFHDEVRSLEDIGLPAAEKVPAAERNRVARALRKLVAKQFAPAELKDAYAERLRQLVAQKLDQGIDVVAADEAATAAAVEDDDIIDLMQVLKRSMQGSQSRASQAAPERRPARQRQPTKRARTARAPAKQAARGGSRGRGARHGRQALEQLSKAELYARAQELDVPGRSSMTKADLVRALRQA